MNRPQLIFRELPRKDHLLYHHPPQGPALTHKIAGKMACQSEGSAWKANRRKAIGAEVSEVVHL